MITVYPRVCGGTSQTRRHISGLAGLSPRVRGNLSELPTPPDDAGSIPACAGEPSSAGVCGGLPQVYPRVCGGTRIAMPGNQCLGGLSPRVRGNPSCYRMRRRRPGSIPACAGEPKWQPLDAGASEVYPRVCGGTVQRGRVRRPTAGLSPRVRGNQTAAALVSIPAGSIPACAGEPVISVHLVGVGEVYPRVCGGTLWPPRAVGQSGGLSPRVRGNRLDFVPGGYNRGSIPACAGEPTTNRPRHAAERVYPRVCGGTIRAGLFQQGGKGLSPRVRGNPPKPPSAAS